MLSEKEAWKRFREWRRVWVESDDDLPAEFGRGAFPPGTDIASLHLDSLSEEEQQDLGRDEEMYFEGLRIHGDFSLPNVMVTGEFSLRNTTIRGDLFMPNAYIGTLILSGARIKGEINLSGLQAEEIICDAWQAAALHHAAPTIPLVYAGGLWPKES